MLVLRCGVGGCDCVLPRRGVEAGFPIIRSRRSRLEFRRCLFALPMPGLMVPLPLPETPPMPLSWSESSATAEPSPAGDGLSDFAPPFCCGRGDCCPCGRSFRCSCSWASSRRANWLLENSRPILFSKENDGIAEVWGSSQLGVLSSSKSGEAGGRKGLWRRLVYDAATAVSRRSSKTQV
jgi:hypothetical protein